ncbi:MAG: hypothetical protein IT481_00310 [Gammaproteobacteria bacterium]|nr:hypothetical protein [Gammaproteobacteria bacterium]
MDMQTRSVDLATLEPPSAVEALRRIADGFKTFQALRAGFGSGLFDWLERHGPAEKSAIAAALQLRGAHLGGFLQALVDLGLLARRGNAYTLMPEMREALCASSPWCQADAFEALLAPACGWSDMRRFLSEGWTPAAAAPSLAPALRPFLGEARRVAAHLAARQAQGRDAAAVRSLLCFDGSAGLLAAALRPVFPAAHVTVVVAPDAVSRAEETLQICGTAARCRVLPGTPLDPPTDERFDYAVVFHSLYSVRKSTVDALTAVAARLNRGGELCLAHWFCLEACETAPGGLCDLDKAVLTDSHPLCHVEEFCQRLEKAGLIDTERGDLAGEYGNTKLHFGRRADCC